MGATGPKSIEFQHEEIMGEGHRNRLVKEFIKSSSELSDAQLVELILTYAIPRRDVRPIAEELRSRFGSLNSIFVQPLDALVSISGLGEKSACLIKAVSEALNRTGENEDKDFKLRLKQAPLPGVVDIGLERETRMKQKRRDRPKRRVVRRSVTPGLRSFTNDLIDIALNALPEAANFSDIRSFRDHLFEHLPLNARSTRERYTQYLLNRFFPGDVFANDIVRFATGLKGTTALKEVIFYLTVANEPIFSKVADEVVWPAAHSGSLSKSDLRNGIAARLHIAKNGIKKTAQAIVRTYARSKVAEVTQKEIRLRLREGNLDALVFVLHREYPEPGMYPLKDCLEGPMHTWLLWSQDWIKQGLYRLREKRIISKVSEIDSIRQLTTRYKSDEAVEEWLKIRAGER